MRQTVENSYEPSELQKGFLFNSLYAKSEYIIKNVFFLNNINLKIFQKAVNYVCNQYDVFKTGFSWNTAGEPIAYLVNDISVPFEYMDMAAMDIFVKQNEYQLIDLSTPPLIKILATKVDDTNSIVLVNTHHMILDGWSLSIVYNEIFNVYNQLTNGEKLTPTKKLRYIDYISQTKNITNGGDLVFWKKYLVDADGFALTDPNLSDSSQSEYGEKIFVFSEETTQSLKLFCIEHALTMNSVLLGMLGVVLGKFLNKNNIVVGMTVSGRTKNFPNIEEMVGQFLNIIPVKIPLPHTTLLNFLNGVQENVVDLLEHSNIPLREIQRVSKRNLFDVQYVFENYPIETTLLNNPHISEIITSQRSEYPLSITTYTQKHNLAIRVNYKTNRLSDETITNLSQDLSKLISIVLQSSSNTLLQKINLLTREEQKKLLYKWNDTARNYPQHKCIHQLFEEQAKNTPDAIAVVYKNQYLTYHVLNSKANQLANYLIKAGVKSEVSVGISLERSCELVISILGVLKSGGIYVPLDLSFPDSRIEYMKGDSSTVLVITKKLLRNSSVKKESEQLSNYKCNTDSLAYIIYTSGSTGTPKGVSISHIALVNRILWMQELYKLTNNDKVLQKTPISFDVSLWEFFWPLISGAQLIMLPSEEHKDVNKISKIIDTQGITVVHFVPSMLEVYLGGNGSLKPIKTLISSGEPLKQKLISDYKLKIHNLYGPTETTIDVTSYTENALPTSGIDQRSNSSVPNKEGSTAFLGRPIYNAKVYILDDDMNPVKTGSIGEIYIAGVPLARGYTNCPELTAESFIANPFESGMRMYKTGDLGRYCFNGNIQYCGRKDRQVKIRGFRIEIAEIENVIDECEEVRSSVVLLNKNAAHLIAYIVPKSTEKLSELCSFKGQNGVSHILYKGGDFTNIRNKVRSKLPDYMIPTNFVFISSIPLTINGKIDNNSLLGLDIKNCSIANSIKPVTDLEKQLCSIWEEVLDKPEIGISEDFFEIGGDSFSAMKIILKMRNMLQINLDLRALFECRTILKLSQLINFREKSEDFSILHYDHYSKIPLSFAQQRVWIMNKILRQKSVYNIPFAISILSKKLDIKRLEKNINFLISRHESFRTNFIEIDGIGYQKIVPHRSLHLAIENIHGEDLSSAMQKEAVKEFDLKNDLLLRAKLFITSEEEYVLHFTVHHIIFDGWSFNIFWDELAALYNGENLPFLTTTYADYSIWQRKSYENGIWANQLDYWKQNLKDVPNCLELPFDRKRPTEPNNDGNRLRFKMNRNLYKKLQSVKAKAQTTMFAVVSSLLNCLLYKYTRQNYIIVGTPVANRRYESLEQVIGIFINTLAIKTCIDEDSSFSTILEQNKEAILKAYENQDVQFDELVDQLKIPRSASINPIFQVLLTVEKMQTLKQLNGSQVHIIPGGYDTSKFDLEIFVLENGDDCYVSIGYSTELFSQSTVSRMFGHLEKIIDYATANPEIKMREICLLTAEEQRTMLYELNNTNCKYSQDKCIHELFYQQVKRTPDAIAVVCGNKHLTYNLLNSKANQLANYLKRNGVNLDTPVGLLMNRSPCMVIAILGILKAGGAYVPLDLSYPGDRIEYMRKNSGAEIVITSDFLKNKKIWENSHELDTAACNSNGLVYVIYTSGSTGKPKGVMITHKNLANRILWLQKKCPMNTNDRFLQKAPISFDISAGEIFQPLLSGAGIVLLSQIGGEKNPEVIEKEVKKWKISLICFVPSMFEAYITATGGLDDVSTVLMGGEGLKKYLYEKSGKKIHNLYGTTETTIDSTYYQEYPTDVIPTGDLCSVGRPIANTKIYILDDGLNPVPYNVAGEIYIGGAGVARGYINRPELTAEKFVANPFGNGNRLYRTGDLGRFLSDRNIEYIGRVDNQVKIRGYRIELGEIEQSIKECDNVKNSAILIGKNKKIIACVVVPKNMVTQEKQNLENKIMEHLRNSLPEYMLPDNFVFLNSIPLTINGKIDSKKIISLSSKRKDKGYIPPLTEIEKQLCEIWQDVLQMARIGVTDNFFKIGGDSILAIQMASRAKALGLFFSMSDIFNYQTIKALSANLKQRENTELLENEYLIDDFEKELKNIERLKWKK